MLDVTVRRGCANKVCPVEVAVRALARVLPPKAGIPHSCTQKPHRIGSGSGLAASGHPALGAVTAHASSE